MARFKQVDGVRRQFTAEEEAAKDAEIEAHNERERAFGYKRKRANEYPAWQDQLDNIYHNGLDAWKASIKTIKDKYSKP